MGGDGVVRGGRVAGPYNLVLCSVGNPPTGNWTTRPLGKRVLFAPVVSPIRGHRVTTDLVLIGHGLSKFRQAVRFKSMVQDISQHTDRSMITILLIAVAILQIQSIRQFSQPQEVLVGAVYPLDTGMLAVSRLIRCFEAALVEHRAEDLRAFEDHLVDVSVTVVAGTERGVGVEDEYVHGRDPDKENPDQEGVVKTACLIRVKVAHEGVCVGLPYRRGDQLGSSTVSTTWITPLLAPTSAATTCESLMNTVSPTTRIARSEPLAVFADFRVTTSAAVTFPATTW